MILENVVVSRGKFSYGLVCYKLRYVPELVEKWFETTINAV
jgi:hypothetical protein